MDGMTTSINAILKNLIKNFNTLLDCPVRFSGEFSEQKIHYFVEYLEYYKRIKCIKDDQALKELQYMLQGHAYDWWMRRKENIETWSEALTILECQYSKKRPANAVYAEVLKHPYANYQSKDDFIDDKMELFTELCEPELTERNKLEIIYALLPNDVQNKIKLEDIVSVKDLKKHLRLVKTVDDDVPSVQANEVLNSETTSELSIVLGENEVSTNTDVNNEASNEKDTNDAHKNEPVIKVRRTEDLMPQDVKEEDQNSEELIVNETKASATNNTLQTNHENFQIDSDIMNQINNIIDETEMSIAAMNNNEPASSSLASPSIPLVSIELLGFNIEPAKQNLSTEHKCKSTLNSIKKNKKRCTYCRHFNHTAQVCFKRAKHIKLFPERFSQLQSDESNNSLNETNNEDIAKTLPTNTSVNSFSSINTQTIEITAVTPNIISSSSSITTPLDPPPVYATSPTVTLNSISERITTSTLTTKLIPAINGKAPNKTLAAKLRSINSPTPKCHQCGTLGFYKSICPNCSPIYSNNSHK